MKARRGGPAPVCSLPGCRAKTLDSTGRCHRHRSVAATRSTTATYAPTSSTTDLARSRFEVPDGFPVWNRNRNGMKTVAYYLDGNLHRTDGPSRVTFGIGEEMVREEWHLHGKLSRTDAPALTEWEHEAGRVSSEQWWLDGLEHRVGGPARVEHEADGSVEAEYHYRHGELHRIDGPAMTYARPISGEEVQVFFADGREVSGLAGVLGVIEEWEHERVESEYRESSYAPLLDDGVPTEAITAALRIGITSVEGVRALHGGAPEEWVRAFEGSRS